MFRIVNWRNSITAILNIQCSVYYFILQFCFISFKTQAYVREKKDKDMRSTLQQKENDTQSSIDERRSETMILSNAQCITIHRVRKDITSNGISIGIYNYLFKVLISITVLFWFTFER